MNKDFLKNVRKTTVENKGAAEKVKEPKVIHATPVGQRNSLNFGNRPMMNRNPRTPSNAMEVERAVRMASRFLPDYALEAAKTAMMEKLEADKKPEEKVVEAEPIAEEATETPAE